MEIPNNIDKLRMTHINLIKNKNREIKECKQLQNELYLRCITSKPRSNSKSLSKTKQKLNSNQNMVSDDYNYKSHKIKLIHNKVNNQENKLGNLNESQLLHFKSNTKFMKNQNNISNYNNSTTNWDSKIIMNISNNSKFKDNVSYSSKISEMLDCPQKFMDKKEIKELLRKTKMNDFMDKKELYTKGRLSKIEMHRSKEQNTNRKIKDKFEVQNYNKLIKENIEIFKNKIIEENKQKKVIIQRKNSIIKQTIKQYIESKKEFINNLCKKELNDQIKKKKNILKELSKLNNI